MTQYRWKALTLPLADGMSEDTSDLDARSPGIQYAQNVDFGRKGEVRPRPCLQLHDVFGQRVLDTTSAAGPADPGTDVLQQRSGNSPLALFRYRDSSGERPGLLTNGRVYTWEGERWTDRLFGCSTRVDRLVEFQVYTSGFSLHNAGDLFACADTFATGGTTANLIPALGTAPSIEYYLPGRRLFGSADNVTVGPDTYHCLVGNNGADGKVYIETRRNGDAAITESLRASATWNTLVRGDNPCCSSFGTDLFIAYLQADQRTIALERFSPVTQTSTVVNSLVTPAADVKGLWINATQGVVYLAYTRTATKGVRIEVYNTALVNQALGVTMDAASANFPAGQVVVGGINTTSAWVAYTTSAGGTYQQGTVIIGKYLTVPSAAVYKTYYGAVSPGDPELTWTLVHQPLSVGNRQIMGLMAGRGHNDGTWYEIDLTNLVPESGVGATPAGTKNPGLVSRGPLASSQSHYNPTAAVKTSATSWRFPTTDYRVFSAAGGSIPSQGLNQVSLLAPQSCQAGEETIIGGSVPHSIARGWSSELEFPFLGAPEITAVVAAGGALANPGSYTIQATWKWIDEAGQLHRSGPSLPLTIATTPGNTSFTVHVLNCQLTEREFGDVQIEYWITDNNPTASSPKYLFASSSPATGQAWTSVVINNVDITADLLYTTGGVFQNRPVSADGGCAAVGKRVWLSDGAKAFSSKIFRGGGVLAPSWNDEGQLEVVTPATAGRIVALEPLDSKLLLLCERGVYYTMGEGPDDLGAGSDFLYPVLVSDIGCAGPRSSVSTPKGVFFHATNSNGSLGDGAYGGIYVTDGLNVKNVSLPVVEELTSSPAELSYNPERELLYVNVGHILVLDLRLNEWSVWIPPAQQNPATTMTCSNAVLWSCSNQNEGPGAYTATDGYDHTSLGLEPVTMLVRTNHLFANGEDGLGWSSIRSVRVLGEPATHTLSMDVTYDQAGPTIHKEFPINAGGTSPTWPSDRYAPEWKLPRQKCGSLQVQLSATPATGAWVALRLDIMPRVHAPVRLQ